MHGPTRRETAFGLVEGARIQGEGFEVCAWLGIPYAAPPVGPLRWRAPRPPAAWTGVRDARAFGLDIPQARLPASRAPGQGEDALVLNVWAPATPPAGGSPVMVWLHGGGFTGGSAADARSDGARLAAAGAVVVAPNYRTGIFGWLAHPGLRADHDHGVSGNYGLLDQIAALHWVRANIAAFGGDPSRVTVFGVSAGSASISLLLTAPQAHGLFHRAALHSPGAGRPLATLEQAEAAATAALGHDIGALRRLGAAELLALTPRLVPAMRGLTTPRVLRPIHDGWLLPLDEREAFASGRLQAVPAIVGTNADEGTLLTRSWPVESREALQQLAVANFGADAPRALELFGEPAGSPDPRAVVAAMFADTQFNYGARLLARTLARAGAPVWRYVFTRRRPGRADGPHHGDEVGHVFGQPSCGRDGEEPTDAIDHARSADMLQAWLAFARDGDPGHPGPAGWPRFDPGADNHLEFGDTLRTGAGWRRTTLDFLEGWSGQAPAGG